MKKLYLVNIKTKSQIDLQSCIYQTTVMISIENHMKEIKRMNVASQKMQKYLELNLRQWNFPPVNPETLPEKITNELKKGSQLIKVISQRLLNRYEQTPFLITKTTPNLELPPENKILTTQNQPLDLSTSPSERRFYSVLPAQTQNESEEAMKYPSDTTINMTNTQLQSRIN